MPISSELLIELLITLAVAFIISFAATPIVKKFAHKVGAMDVPTEERRVHDHPIPRLGGLAIFLGFLLSILLFVDITRQVQGILIGAIIVVVVGAIDDLISLPAWVKFIFQVVAAVVAVGHGVVISFFTNPNVFSPPGLVFLGILSIPITIVWIVGVTNSVNLIDGLDGLAVGVSAIASLTMLIVAVFVAEDNVALILAALTGSCVGFIPYNRNPAKIFMGDAGALLLGYVLATVSVLGMFKFYAIVSFVVPFVALAVPILDTFFAFFRRLIKGQNPMKPDRGHFHHRLLDLGLSQKQAVAILYFVSAILGVAAVLLATTGELKILIFIIAFCVAAAFSLSIAKSRRKQSSVQPSVKSTVSAPSEEAAEESQYEEN